MSSYQPRSTDTAGDALKPTDPASSCVWEIRAVPPPDSAVEAFTRELRSKLRSVVRLKPKQRLSDLYTNHASNVNCTLSHDLFTFRFKLSSQPFVGRFAYIDPHGSQIAPQDVHCESTLVLTGMKGYHWRPEVELEALRAWADAQLSRALSHSPDLQRSSPVTVSHNRIHSEGCEVVTFIYAPKGLRRLEVAKPLNCCNSLPPPSADAPPIHPPMSALSGLPTDIVIVDELTEMITYDTGCKEPKDWRIFHALKLRVSSQSTGNPADEPQQAGPSSTGQGQ